MLSRRGFVRASLFAIGSVSVSACGGGSGAGEATSQQVATESPLVPAPPVSAPPVSAPPVPPPPVPSPGATLTTLQVRSNAAGSFPYAATVLPLRGAVPSGFTLESPDDGALSASILSVHDDGSASVLVVAGSTTVLASASTSIRLQAVRATAVNALTPAAISAAVSSVVIDFGATYGKATIADFSAPERVWWANRQVICARYRAAPTSAGNTKLEVVADIHAYAGGRVMVELVVENGRMTSASPVKPVAANYGAAVVSVNGASITTVNGNGGPEGLHEAFRSWYASAWVGGATGLRVTQSHSDLQAHPLLFKCVRAGTSDMAAYAGDTYTPWSPGRHRAAGMGSGGDHDSIGHLPKWEAHFLQTGDYRAANAAESNALCIVGYNVGYRDSSGTVPTLTQVAGRDMRSVGNWPSLYAGNGPMGWEVAHHPAVGLMAFVSRPSPVFIELAQKVAIWNATWSTFVGDRGPGAGTLAPTGLFGAVHQTRAKAWGIRSLAHAIFLTPDSHPWKAPAQTSLALNVNYLSQFSGNARSKLNVFYGGQPDWPVTEYNVKPSGAAFGTSHMQQSYLLVALHSMASARLLRGADQVKADSLADWAAGWAARWVNEQSNGSWRYISIGIAMGRDPASATGPNSPDTWTAMRAYTYPNQAPPAQAGTWMTSGLDEPSALSDYTADTRAGAYYPSYFWSALVAAVERNATGAGTAWTTVQSDINNLSGWLDGFAGDPRWGSVPRNR